MWSEASCGDFDLAAEGDRLRGEKAALREERLGLDDERRAVMRKVAYSSGTKPGYAKARRKELARINGEITRVQGMEDELEEELALLAADAAADAAAAGFDAAKAVEALANPLAPSADAEGADAGVLAGADAAPAAPALAEPTQPAAKGAAAGRPRSPTHAL